MPARVIAHRFDVQRDVKRQKVLERIETHALGDQRGPLRFHLEAFRGDGVGEQSRQRSE